MLRNKKVVAWRAWEDIVVGPSPTPNVYRCVCDAAFTETDPYNKHIAICFEAESYRRPADEQRTQRED